MAKENEEVFCPAHATMELLGQKWTLHIIHSLADGKKRFNELAQAVGGVNSRTLSQRLRELEVEGIVVKHTLSTIPPWVEYELTEKGLALGKCIETLTDWGRNWMKPPG
ncbi:MAG: winged helix-turn-helix transcriptional regulator [Candidatus Aquicultorales bacterium]